MNKCFICMDRLTCGGTRRASGLEVKGEVLMIMVCHDCMKDDFPGDTCTCDTCQNLATVQQKAVAQNFANECKRLWDEARKEEMSEPPDTWHGGWRLNDEVDGR